MSAKPTGRSIKRMVQPREITLDEYSWESPVAGQTRRGRDTRRSSTFKEKARACREEKGMSTCREPGVRPAACRERQRKNGPEVLPSPPYYNDGKRVSSWEKLARYVLGAEGCRSGLEVKTDKTTELVPSVRPYFHRVWEARKDA